MRVCIFCGSEGLTREHIYPEWIFNFIGGLDKLHFTPNLTVVGISQIDNDDLFLDRQNQDRTIPYKKFVVRCVCGACNNGWMSLLENKAIPLFKKLLYAELDLENLTSDEAFILARWAILRAIMVCQAHVEPTYFDESLLDTLKNGRITDGFRVEVLKGEVIYLNYVVNGYPETVAVNIPKEELLPKTDGFFLAGFQIGHLMFRISFLNEDSVFRLFLNQKPFTLFPFNQDLPLVTGKSHRNTLLLQHPNAELELFCSNIILSDCLPNTG